MRSISMFIPSMVQLLNLKEIRKGSITGHKPMRKLLLVIMEPASIVLARDQRQTRSPLLMVS